MHEKIQSRNPNLDGWLWIVDPETIEHLANPNNLACLMPFLGYERTLSEAAEELQTNLSRMHYQVSKLIKMNLLYLTRSKARAGRAIKHYTARANRLFVPFDTTSFASLEEALERANLTLSRSLSQHVARHAFSLGLPTGLCITRGQSGGLVIEPSIAPAAHFDPLLDSSPAMIPGTWTSDLLLDFQEAKALQRELEALRIKYSGKSGAQRYQMHTALVPISD